MIDLRASLPRREWSIGTRSLTNYVTLHYNGPAVSQHRQSGDGLIEQLRIDCAWQMRTGWGGSTDGADGIQYHYVVASTGDVYQCRDENASLWHCGHATGNTQSISIHLPLGGDQDATAEQWQATSELFQTLCDRYHLPRTRVVGHCEWGSSACPGPHLMSRLRAWRVDTLPIPPPPATAYRLRIRAGMHGTIRQGPGRSFDVAGDLGPGRVFWADKYVIGEQILKDSRWAHMASIPHQQADLGFVHMSACEMVAG